jgi:hypothetical protein
VPRESADELMIQRFVGSQRDGIGGFWHQIAPRIAEHGIASTLAVNLELVKATFGPVIGIYASLATLQEHPARVAKRPRGVPKRLARPGAVCQRFVVPEVVGCDRGR